MMNLVHLCVDVLCLLVYAFFLTVYPDYLTPEAKDILARLLDVNESTRLGSGFTGEADLKCHPFFAGIDWDKLEQRQIEPPVIPVVPEMREVSHPDLKSMMKYYDREAWLTESIKPEWQALFKTW